MSNLHHSTNSRNLSESASGLARTIERMEARGANPFVLHDMRQRLAALSKIDGDPRACVASFGGAF